MTKPHGAHSHGAHPHSHDAHSHSHDAHPHSHGAHPHSHGAHPHSHGAHPHSHDAHHHHADVRGDDPLRHGNPRLERGAGRGRLLFFDCFSGVAGDMTAGALVDLGVPLEVMNGALQTLGVSGLEVRVHPALSGMVGGIRFEVVASGAQPERSYAQIDALLARADLDDDTRRRARAIFRHLAEAEALVHRTPVADVSFHEVGAVDAIADIVSAAAGLSYLGAEIVCAPLPMGHGVVQCRHGTLPLPAPATLACLRGIPTYAADIGAELVTPTGAAIVASQAAHFERWPALAPLAIGWGAGSRVLPGRVNALRLVLGDPQPNALAAQSATHVVIEANVDDMTGELAGHAIAELLAAGALDAWASPLTMKKGRPGLLLSALSRLDGAALVESAMLRETSSIGLRRFPVSRVERPRRSVEVATQFGNIPVKVSAGPFGPPQLKPEFDACAAAAKLHGVPVRQVIAAAIHAAEHELG
jgi:hypothetical protein